MDIDRKSSKDAGLYNYNTNVPDYEIESLARCLLPKIQAFFSTPEGQAAFEEWKRQQNNNNAE